MSVVRYDQDAEPFLGHLTSKEGSPQADVDTGRKSEALAQFGFVIRTLRKGKKLSQFQLASKTGLDAGLIRLMEEGYASFDQVVESLNALADGLGVRPETLAATLVKMIAEKGED